MNFITIQKYMDWFKIKQLDNFNIQIYELEFEKLFKEKKYKFFFLIKILTILLFFYLFIGGLYHTWLSFELLYIFFIVLIPIPIMFALFVTIFIFTYYFIPKALFYIIKRKNIKIFKINNIWINEEQKWKILNISSLIFFVLSYIFLTNFIKSITFISINSYIILFIIFWFIYVLDYNILKKNDYLINNNKKDIIGKLKQELINRNYNYIINYNKEKWNDIIKILSENDLKEYYIIVWASYQEEWDLENANFYYDLYLKELNLITNDIQLFKEKWIDDIQSMKLLIIMKKLDELGLSYKMSAEEYDKWKKQDKRKIKKNSIK